MNDIFSSQRTTNILLVVLIAAIFAFTIYIETRVSKIQRSLYYIGENTSEMNSSLSQIKDGTKYIEIYTGQTANTLKR